MKRVLCAVDLSDVSMDVLHYAQAIVQGYQDWSMNMQQTLKWSMFIAAAAGVVYLCALMLQPFLLVIAWSVVKRI